MKKADKLAEQGELPQHSSSPAGLLLHQTAAICRASLPAELLAQFLLGSHQCPLARGGQILPRTIDVEREHGERGAEGIGFAAPASFGRPFQRCRDPLGIAQREHTPLEGKRIAVLGDLARPAPSAARTPRRRPSGAPALAACVLRVAPSPLRRGGFSCHEITMRRTAQGSQRSGRCPVPPLPPRQPCAVGARR